jgi:hypothetical protein
MMGQDWHLRTVASRAFCSSLGDLRCGPWMMILTGANFQLVYQTLWQPLVLAGSSVSRDISVAAPSTGWFPVSRDISGNHQYCLVSCQTETSLQRVGEGNENLVSLFLLDFKRSFTCRKILRHGTFPLYFPSEGRCAADFIALKNPSPWPGSNPQPFESSGKHTNHYTTKVTPCV